MECCVVFPSIRPPWKMAGSRRSSPLSRPFQDRLLDRSTKFGALYLDVDRTFAGTDPCIPQEAGSIPGRSFPRAFNLQSEAKRTGTEWNPCNPFSFRVIEPEQAITFRTEVLIILASSSAFVGKVVALVPGLKFTRFPNANKTVGLEAA
jgi:hypothetical protein